MRIEANGIHHQAVLEGPPGSPVVMMCHALGTRAALWDWQAPALADHYRVLRYDVRGHGDTDAPPGPYSLPLLARDAIALMDAFEVEQVHWVGISLGGMVGQQLAVDHHARLASLTLADTTARIPPEARPAWAQRIERARDEGLEALLDETLERWFTPEFRAAHPAIVERIAGWVLSTPIAGYVGCAEAVMELDLLEALGSVRIPTLVLVGEHDPGTPVAAAEAIHRRIPGSVLEVLPRARHLTNVEASEAFNTLLRSFLAANR